MLPHKKHIRIDFQHDFLGERPLIQRALWWRGYGINMARKGITGIAHQYRKNRKIQIFILLQCNAWTILGS